MRPRRQRRDRPLAVYAFDPSVGRRFGNHHTLRVPYEALRPGPIGRLVAVIDEEKGTGKTYPPVNLDDPSILLAGGLAPAEFDVRFHQQMTYAVASYTIELFQNALGRPIQWPWAKSDEPDDLTNRLRIYPHAMEQENAFVVPDQGTMHFGYFTAKEGTGAPGQRVYSCLSFDIIAHQTVQAVLTALGREGTSSQHSLGWQEGVADLVALLHHFTLPAAVLETIQRSPSGRLHDSIFLPDVLARTESPMIQAELGVMNPLCQVAPQFGAAIGLGKAIRTALESAPGSQDLATTTAPHDRGAILVAAVFDAMFSVYALRSRDLLRISGVGAASSGLHPDLAHRLTREAVKTAREFLTLCIRAIDYCPPGPVAFGDYLRALITVSSDLAPEQEADHRAALTDAFRSRGIPPGHAGSYSEEALRWTRLPAATAADRCCQDLEFDRADADEAESNSNRLAAFLASAADAVGLEPNLPVEVEGPPLRISQRIAGDGTVVREIVAAARQQGAGHGVQATQADHGVQATQAGEGVQATQDGEGVQATQADHGVQATQAGDGAGGGPVRATVILDEFGVVTYVIRGELPSGAETDPLMAPAAGAPPTTRPLRVFAFDPSHGRKFGNVMTIRVPYEPLEPGPVGAKVAVIDFDGPNGCYYQAAHLEGEDVMLEGGLEPREDDPRFHQQMVYAVATETIRRFEFALGRPVKWAWDTKRQKNPLRRRLRIVPHALQDANAYFDPDLGALLFGYFQDERQEEDVIFTCLSHDIVAHETTHALVHDVRPRLLDHTGPDSLAFHEAFSDLVALFQHFSFTDALHETVLRTGGRIHSARLDPELREQEGDPRIQAELAPSNPLVEIARQFGEAMGSRAALREAIGTPPGKHELDVKVEPHARGAILVAAVFDAFFSVYVRRTADLIRLAHAGGVGISRVGDLHPDLASRLTREAAKTARHFLTICVRAMDYLPPVDVTFGDFLRAVVTSDGDLIPDDTWHYRDAIIDAFRSRGIRVRGVTATAEPALRWPLHEPELHFGTRKDANPFRGASSTVAIRLNGFAKVNAEALHLNPDLPIQIIAFHPDSRRVDPTSGLRQQEFLVQCVQKQEQPLDPEDPSSPTFTFRGGSTLLFDADGWVRYVISKPIADAARLERERQHRLQLDMTIPAAAFGPPPEPTNILARLHRGW